jgi:hypothetical protein
MWASGRPQGLLNEHLQKFKNINKKNVELDTCYYCSKVLQGVKWESW